MKDPDQIFIWASSHFLTEEFPATWEDMTHDELLGFIADNRCEFNEYEDPAFIYDQIIQLGDSATQFFKED